MLIARFDNKDAVSEVLKIESQYSIQLPQQYRDFLLQYNGGYTPKTKFKSKKIASDVRGFYGVGSVALSMNQELLEAWMPKMLLPIACDSFGNHILLCVAGNNYGSVFFSDHEKGMAASLIADSFASFLRICKSDKIPEAARRSIEERKAALIANGRESVITPALISMWQNEIDKYGDMIQEEVVL